MQLGFEPSPRTQHDHIPRYHLSQGKHTLTIEPPTLQFDYFHVFLNSIKSQPKNQRVRTKSVGPTMTNETVLTKRG